MNTIINVDVNALLAELKQQAKSTQKWKTLTYALLFYVGAKCCENKKLKEKNKNLTAEIEVLKTTKGE